MQSMNGFMLAGRQLRVGLGSDRSSHGNVRPSSTPSMGQSSPRSDSGKGSTADTSVNDVSRKPEEAIKSSQPSQISSRCIVVGHMFDAAE